MRATIFFSLLLSLTFKINEQFTKIGKDLKRLFFNKTGINFYKRYPELIKITIISIFILLSSGFQAKATDTIVTVRFANPRYTCAAQTYKLDVEFQCNVSGLILYGMNVRFYYADNILEFTTFEEFLAGYKKMNTPYKTTGSDTSGMAFGFPGPSEFLNGVIQKYSTPNTYLPTTTWLKVFCVTFHVDDPEVMNDPDFCPSVIWDKKEPPAQGGFSGSQGVVITFYNLNANPTENVIQFNWQYNTDGDPYNPPYGFPIATSCISAERTYSPTNYLPASTFEEPGLVNIPVIVTNFFKIGHFNTVFEYDPTVMTYVNNTPNAIFNTNNGLLYVTDSVSAGGKNKITMKYQRQGTVAITLSDSAHLTDLHFNYITGTSDLTWITTNNSCHYVDSLLVAKCDQPYSDYYINGTVSMPSFLAPVTKIDSNVAFVGDYVTYAVKVWDFENIHSGLLTLDYDPDVLEFYDAVPNAAYSNVFEEAVVYPGRLEMTWSGNDTSLTDESVLAYLTFEYMGGDAPLLWFDDGASCEYVNTDALPLGDEPSEEFYINGNVTSAEFIWTGGSSSDWNNSSNWENGVVPDQFTNVSIDPGDNPDNWPTFDGNFTLGEDCNNLSLNDNAHFSVSGDFTINPGHSLNFSGLGILQIGGSWTNSGIFNAGLGTVEFTGASDGIIDEGVPPGDFVAAYVLSTFTAGMTPITGGSAGPTGDDNHLDVNIGFVFNYLGVNYSQLRINTNGWLSLNLSGDDAVASDNTILFSTSVPGTTLAPWWDDLEADANSIVSYKIEGIAPSRIFTAEWKNILAFNSGSNVRLNFQVKLSETTNIIEFRYGTVTGGSHNSAEGASIGIKDATGGLGNFIEATHNSSTLILAFLNSGTDWPAVNFRFTPPVENPEEIFNRLLISKTPGKLYLQKDVRVTGMN